jgi:hypothetical protein
MPLPVDVKQGTEPTLRQRLGRWLRRAAPPQPVEQPALEPQHVPAESIERSYWAPRQRPASRVEQLVREHEQGGTSTRPRANPAFSEALFVELMRGRQYRRAYEQLSDECKQRWGSPETFAAAQGSTAMRRLRGVRVKDVRFLPEWNDPDAGRTYQEVAELQVEYTIAEGTAATVLPRTVHLVPQSGKWRSLCYP